MEKSVGEFMVKCPYVGEEEMSIKQVSDLMLECDIRHLPIVRNEKVVGILSERDIGEAKRLPESLSLKAKDIMKRDLFLARRESSLASTVRYMQEEKLGSALVVNDQRECVGIFTTTDALGVLADLLEADEGDTNRLDLDDFVNYWHSNSEL